MEESREARHRRRVMEEFHEEQREAKRQRKFERMMVILRDTEEEDARDRKIVRYSLLAVFVVIVLALVLDSGRVKTERVLPVEGVRP